MICQRATNASYSDTLALFANQLLVHRNAAQFGYLRAEGTSDTMLGIAREAINAAPGAVVNQYVDDVCADVLTELVGGVVPFGGLAVRLVRRTPEQRVPPGTYEHKWRLTLLPERLLADALTRWRRSPN